LFFSHATQIREDFNELEQQVKVTLPTGNHTTLTTRRQGKAQHQENDKSAFGTIALE